MFGLGSKLFGHQDVAVLGFHDGSAGQIETWFEEVSGYRIACFVHESEEPLEVDAELENTKRVSQRTEFPSTIAFKERPLISSLNWVDALKERGIGKVLPLTPNNRVRLKQIEKCKANGLELVSAIHPTANILSGATIEPGVWVNANSVIGYKAEVREGVLINTGVQIDHHNVMERCSQIDPGAVFAGNVTLRECAQVHTGATIINQVEIGQNAIVGAGAVVINNIPPNCTAVGVPAVVIKHFGIRI